MEQDRPVEVESNMCEESIPRIINLNENEECRISTDESIPRIINFNENEESRISTDESISRIINLNENEESRISTDEKCNENIEAPEEIWGHRPILQEILPFKCNLCKYRSLTRDLLRKHMVVHYAVPVYSCEQCGFETIRESALAKHIEQHEDASFKLKMSSFKPMQNYMN